MITPSTTLREKVLKALFPDHVLYSPLAYQMADAAIAAVREHLADGTNRAMRAYCGARMPREGTCSTMYFLNNDPAMTAAILAALGDE